MKQCMIVHEIAQERGNGNFMILSIPTFRSKELKNTKSVIMCLFADVAGTEKNEPTKKTAQETSKEITKKMTNVSLDQGEGIMDGSIETNETKNAEKSTKAIEENEKTTSETNTTETNQTEMIQTETNKIDTNQMETNKTETNETDKNESNIDEPFKTDSIANSSLKMQKANKKTDAASMHEQYPMIGSHKTNRSIVSNRTNKTNRSNITNEITSENDIILPKSLKEIFKRKDLVEGCPPCPAKG